MEYKKERKPCNYWTFDKCREEALKYENSTDMAKNSSGAYCRILKKSWSDELFFHFKVMGNSFRRYIYVYEFSDNSVYIGLTYNLKQRDREHKKEGSVFEHVEKTGLTTIMKQITPNPIESQQASKLEKFYVEKYKKEGWFILNKVRAGSLGGNTIKWDKESCKKEALKYKRRSDFKSGNTSAYYSANNNEWLPELCAHMDIDNKPRGYYTFNKCVEIAKLCENRKEFSEKHPRVIDAIYRNKWHSILFDNFKELKKIEYSLEYCIAVSKKYTTINAMRKEHGRLYRIIDKNKWNKIIIENLKTKF